MEALPPTRGRRPLQLADQEVYPTFAGAPAGVVRSGAMGFSRWVVENWFDLLQSGGIVAGLLLTTSSLRSESKTRRVSNLLAITESHRKVWIEFYHRPELKRVLDERVDLTRSQITREEEIFVNFVIFHLNSVFYARKAGLIFKLEGLRRDTWWFFSLPIPRAIWEKTKILQNNDFVAFVESCRNWK